MVNNDNIVAAVHEMNHAALVEQCKYLTMQVDELRKQIASLHNTVSMLLARVDSVEQRSRIHGAMLTGAGPTAR
jgi:prefoldin subunit 5